MRKYLHKLLQKSIIKNKVNKTNNNTKIIFEKQIVNPCGFYFL